MAVDPICKMTVDESTAISAEKDGITYYFCCENCRQKFLQPVSTSASGRPLVALDLAPKSCCHGESAHATVTPPPSGSGVKFYCPMCPGVVSDVPASCPQCGMALEPVPGSSASLEHDDSAELREMTRRLIVALVLGVPLFIVAMLPMLLSAVPLWLSGTAGRLVQWGLASPVVLWCGWPFFDRAISSLRHGRMNMFTLIGLGTGVAYLYSTVAVLVPRWIPAAFHHGGHPALYFESAAMIIALVLVGQILELRARRQTGGAFRSLMELTPPSARRIVLQESPSQPEQVEEIPVSEVQVGDTLRVIPGSRVPVDGEIVSGTTSIDESMMTGESDPVHKGPGDSVVAGSVNQLGAFTMQANRIGKDTMVAQMVQWVAEAQRSRAPIQRLADRVAGYFVPLVIVASLVTFVVWARWSPVEPRLGLALVNAVAVLIIACPCALGLATPMSIMVGVGRGAREGVLIKNAEVLETLGKTEVLMVDKTGTLTAGRPLVTSIRAIGPNGSDTAGGAAVLEAAAAVAAQSEHPLAVAIVAAAKERGISGTNHVRDFSATPGAGMQGTVDSQRVRVGSWDYVSAESDWADRQLEMIGNGGVSRASRSYVAVAGQLLGYLEAEDAIRDSAREAIHRLRGMGIRVVMLTGDRRPVAEHVARQLGLDEFHAELSPKEKLEWIRKLRGAGQRVAMAGDGINDAPALAEADIGIAMGTGTEIAMEAADVTLVKGDLMAITRAISLARRVMTNIRQNLFFAFIYNALGIPVAAGILYPFTGWLLGPVLAAAAMSFSSVSVIANALRLRASKA